MNCECGHAAEDHQHVDAQGVPFRVPCHGWIWYDDGRKHGVAVCSCTRIQASA